MGGGLAIGVRQGNRGMLAWRGGRGSRWEAV